MLKALSGRLTLVVAVAGLFSCLVIPEAKADAPAAPASIVDLNTASQGELEALKGVGPATAKKIIAGRPYQSVDELTGKGVPARTVDLIRPFVTVGGAKPAAPVRVATERSLAPPPPSNVTGETSPAGPVDLNTASEASLENLPGVGPATGKAIVAGRPYSSVDDLKKVKGIGPAKLAALRGLVTVSAAKTPVPVPSRTSPPSAHVATPAPSAPSPAPSSPPTSAAPAPRSSAGSVKLAPGQKVNLNTASLTELEALPGIGPVKAQKIIDGRPYAKPEDVMKVSGIKEGVFGKIKDFITVQ